MFMYRLVNILKSFEKIASDVEPVEPSPRVQNILRKAAVCPAMLGMEPIAPEDEQTDEAAKERDGSALLGDDFEKLDLGFVDDIVADDVFASAPEPGAGCGTVDIEVGEEVRVARGDDGVSDPMVVPGFVYVRVHGRSRTIADRCEYGNHP